MVKTLVKLVVLLAILLIGYNFFFGTPQEQESSRRVVAQVRDLSSNVFDLLKSEKNKFDEGKYDAALDKVKSAIGLQRQQASQSHHECLGECEHLQQQHDSIEARLRNLAFNNEISAADRESAYTDIRDEILQLTRRTESLSDEWK